MEIPHQDDATAAAALDQLSGGVAADLDTIWDEEWKNTALAAAIEQMKQQISPEQYQIFDLYVLRQMPVSQVAGLLGTSIPRIYLTKHRLSKLLRGIIAKFEKAGDRL